jgi:hypothetical protein
MQWHALCFFIISRDIFSKRGKPLEEKEMNFNEIRTKAKGMSINTYRMKKTEVIRSIQRAENNIDCYATPRAKHCNEDACLWRNDCLAQKEKENERG